MTTSQGNGLYSTFFEFPGVIFMNRPDPRRFFLMGGGGGMDKKIL